jgi:HTH-type transcriptional regulator/antitoxin MqsA
MADCINPETGAPLHRGVRPLTLTYKGQSMTVDMPGWYGDRPDDGVFDPADMKISDRALNRLKARTEGLLEPEGIRRIRKKLRLTQEAAGELIGGGPRAFQRYEAGDLLPSRAISSALMLLDHDPSALAVLTAHCAAGRAKSTNRKTRRTEVTKIEIPVAATTASALSDTRRLEAVGRLIDRIVQPGADDPLIALLDRISTEAHALGLTDAKIESELAAYNGERRD